MEMIEEFKLEYEKLSLHNRKGSNLTGIVKIDFNRYFLDLKVSCRCITNCLKCFEFKREELEELYHYISLIQNLDVNEVKYHYNNIIKNIIPEENELIYFNIIKVDNQYNLILDKIFE